jgi:ABC-type multidrug transport system fused ATPase/permease subunit
VTLPTGDTTDDPRPGIAFKAVDELSGIDRYELTFFTNENEVTTVHPEDMPDGVFHPAAQAPGKKLLIVKAFDKAGNKTTETAEFTIREVKGLVITSYPETIDENSAIRIAGRSFPQSKIVFTLSNAASGQQFTDQTQATATGEFSLTWGKKIPAGVYELTAVNTDTRGAISTLDRPLKIEVTRSLFARLWTLILNYLSVIILGLLGVLGAGVVVWFIRHKIRLMRKRLNAQVSDADAVVHSTLNLLREDIAACTELLKRANSAGDLAKEGELLKRLSNDLNQVEELIENKVHKIGE